MSNVDHSFKITKSTFIVPVCVVVCVLTECMGVRRRGVGRCSLSNKRDMSKVTVTHCPCVYDMHKHRLLLICCIVSPPLVKWAVFPSLID